MMLSKLPKKNLFLSVICASLLASATAAADETASQDTHGNDKIPSKIIKIYNNTDNPIYPVIETSTNSTDEWLQAEFKIPESELKLKRFPHTNVYRVYVNWPSGISPHSYIAMDVPFYSKLVDSPNGVLPDQYVNWWNGGRVIIYNSLLTLEKAQERDASHKVNTLPTGLSCSTADPLSECGALTTYADKAALTDESPSQLTEYTFGGAITAEAPYKMAYQDVDYDISYVDHLYLPIAMAPAGNPYIGYTGSVLSENKFKGVLDKFLAADDIGYGWPTFLIADDKNESIKKLPGAYKVIMGTPGQNITQPGEAIDKMYALWGSCIAEPYGVLTKTRINCPQALKPDLEKIDKFFKQNYAQYIVNPSCDHKLKVPDSAKNMIAQIYGWVPFNQYCGSEGAKVNALCKTSSTADPAKIDPNPYLCTKEYTQIHALYRKLQYSYKDYPGVKELFNPYVPLIHDKKYLGMDAYAFSIDDAVGNMQELGNGLIIVVGGSEGLVNKLPFKPHEAIKVNMGSPKALNMPDWKSYGACEGAVSASCEPEVVMDLPPNTPSFKLGTLQKFPVTVVVQDGLDRRYQFTINGPLGEGGVLPADTIKNCTAPAKGWCDGLYVHISKDDDGHTFNNIQTPPPPPE